MHSEVHDEEQESEPVEPWRTELAAAISDVPGYAAMLSDVDKKQLARRHEFVDTVATSSALQEGEFFHQLALVAGQLRDLCAIEGMRRGVIFVAGNDPQRDALH